MGCALLLPYLYALGFCFPRGDDFDEACRAMFLFDLPGGIYEIAREWFSWSGRYTYHFLAVFLGKAAHLRFAASLVCATIMAIYFLSLYKIASQESRQAGKSVLFAIFGLATILSCWQTLPDFYLFTDVLTISLQGGASLAFFAAILNLWHTTSNTEASFKAFRIALVTGILAIGVYEHAALAVFFATMLALCACFYYRRNPKPFLILAFWIILAILFSFLAPGNFQRQIIRQSGGNFADVPADWLFCLISFASSSWPWCAMLLGIILRTLKSGQGTSPGSSLPIIPVFAVFAGACLLALAFALLHAQSDFTLQSHVKFISSISLYLAFAVGMITYMLTDIIPARFYGSLPPKICLALCIIVLSSICVFGRNFELAAMNAANGQLLVYGHFMKTRIDYLEMLGKSVKDEEELPKFGLAGEIFRKDSRSPRPDPTLPEGIVCSFDEKAFPDWTSEDLKQDPAVWPNKWAAWLYGLYGVKSCKPDPKAALDNRNGAMELVLPDALKNIVMASQIETKGINPTFRISWLVLDFEGSAPEHIYVLRANPLSQKRLLPMPMQKTLLEKFLKSKTLEYGFLEKLCATRLVFETRHWRAGNSVAMPIISSIKEESIWPKIIFLALDDKNYYRLIPWMN